MTKSQNTKNEQQKDLCITSEQLTEQWKRGEFIICNAGKCQYYYVRNEEQQEVIKTEYCLFDDNTPNWQILAPVPSYEEYEQLENWNRFTADYHALREAIEIAEYEKVEHLEKVKQLK